MRMILCPMCGRRRMVRRREDQLCRRIDGRPILVPKVAFKECSACGERLYRGRALDREDLYRGFLNDGDPPARCPVCGGRRFGRGATALGIEHANGHAARLSDLSFWRCRRCGERFYPRESVTRIQRSWRPRRAIPANGPAKA